MSLIYYDSFFSYKIDVSFVSVINMSSLVNTTVLYTVIRKFINIELYIHMLIICKISIFFKFLLITSRSCAALGIFNNDIFVFRYSVESHCDLYVLDFYSFHSKSKRCNVLTDFI